jgi:hypothetical protein
MIYFKRQLLLFYKGILVESITSIGQQIFVYAMLKDSYCHQDYVLYSSQNR